MTNWQKRAESRLNSILKDIFRGVTASAMSELLRLGRVPSNDIARRQIIRFFEANQQRMAQSILDDALTAAQHGRNRTISELQRAGISIGFTEFSPQLKELIRDHVFEASASTMARLAGDVMGNLTSAYEEGLGIDAAASRLRGEFDGMLDWELRRIARTEIQSFQNEGAYLTEEELGVHYHQWITAGDSRVRGDPGGEYPEAEADHAVLHGQIVRHGDNFQNGLKYPGDRTGPLYEWINCRCRVVPYLMPEGMKAPPGLDWFYPEDLIAV